MRALGVDVGGVVIQRADDDADTSFFGGNYLATPAVPGAFEALAGLVSQLFGERVFLVSTCGVETERRTLEWLAHHDFHRRTGIPPHQVHFCRRRADKAPIAASLSLTHFVDDRLEVLGYLRTVRHRYLFRPRDVEVRRHAQHLPLVRRVDGWSALVAEIREPGSPARPAPST
jgi:hypothetical protein